MKVVCFVLYIDVSESMASCHILGIFGQFLMIKGALTWIESVWNYSVKLLIIEPFSQ
jgi:hypothetical protein